MTAFSKFLVLLAIFLSASYANAIASLSPVAGNQVLVNHLIQFEESMSKPTNEQSSEPICKPTNDQINDQNDYKEEPLQKHCCTDLGIQPLQKHCCTDLGIQPLQKHCCTDLGIQSKLSSQVKRQTVINN
jgi:hypothetical protein